MFAKCFLDHHIAFFMVSVHSLCERRTSRNLSRKSHRVSRCPRLQHCKQGARKGLFVGDMIYKCCSFSYPSIFVSEWYILVQRLLILSSLQILVSFGCSLPLCSYPCTEQAISCIGLPFRAPLATGSSLRPLFNVAPLM